MKIKHFFTLSFILLFNVLMSQVADELILIHNVTTSVEMNAILNPSTGALIFNSEKNNLFVFDGTVWVLYNYIHTPYITNVNAETVNTKQTKTVSFRGIDFIPTTTLTIPNFTGTINSITVVSPFRIDVNVTATATTGFYNVIVSNNSNINTSWVGNGVAKFEVIEANGTDKNHANLTCKAILDDGFSTGDGLYWINPDEDSTDNAFQVHCDMTTNGGGWTRLDYVEDLELKHQFGGQGDASRWINTNFKLTLTDTQINNIRSLSTEGKQTYVGECNGVLHHFYNTSGTYNSAVGFRYHTGFETASRQETYPATNITVTQDGCATNNNTSLDSVFEIIDIRVPVINIISRDSGDKTEQLGSPLTLNPAWLR